jgi:voltage-gated potassium channel
MIKHFRNELSLAASLFLLLVLTGTLGYHFGQDFSWTDALYMTIITITTVGFGEVHPLNTSGKILTIFLILSSIIVYGYAITVVTEYVIGENIFKKLILKRMENKIQKLKDHVIIVGFGRTGKQAVKKLRDYNKKVVVIDINKPEEDAFIDYEKVYFVEGDATKDDVLLKANIKHAKGLITTINNDAENLFVVLSSRQLNPKIKLVSRASSEKSKDKMKLAGANRVVLPEVIGGEHMASMVVTPDLVEFINALSLEDSQHKTNLEEIHFSDLPPESQGKSIANLDLRRKTGCTIIGYKTPGNQYIINPSPDTILEKGSAIIVLGQPEQIAKLNELFHLSHDI